MLCARTLISPRWVRNDLALDAHDVADVELLELLIDLLVHLVLTGVELDAAVPVLQVAER